MPLSSNKKRDTDVENLSVDSTSIGTIDDSQKFSNQDYTENQSSIFASDGNTGDENSTVASSTAGLSQTEMQDPNKITVTVSDEKTPLVILFGPPACGKTMTLVRMTRFLKDKKDYTIKPDETFRGAEDEHYAEMCENFNEMITNESAAKSTSRLSFMLVKVFNKSGKPICQILEAPGEYYFDPGKTQPNTQFPTFVNTIINGNYRKIWLFMVEPNWKSYKDRKGYSNRIAFLKRKMDQKDKVIFVLNKIDMEDQLVIGRGKVNISEARQSVERNYEGIFNPFKNQNPVTKLWKAYNCDFVPFQTGDYVESMDGLVWQPGTDTYCEALWNCIIN